MSSKARAYARQARDDFDAFVSLEEAAVRGVGEHHRVLLLQMAIEKMAKAFLYDAEPASTYSHNALIYVRRRLQSHDVAAATGLRPIETLMWRLRRAWPTFVQVTAASPSVGPDGTAISRAESESLENVEYPWRVPPDQTRWTTPADHDFSVVRLLRRDAQSAAAIGLLDRLIDAAATIVS